MTNITKEGVIGIIGSSHDALLITLELQKLGLSTQVLNQDPQARVSRLADAYYNAQNMKEIISFALSCSKIILIDNEINQEVLLNLTGISQFVQNAKVYLSKFQQDRKASILDNPYVPTNLYRMMKTKEEFNQLLHTEDFPLEVRYGQNKRIIYNSTSFNQVANLADNHVLYVRKKHQINRFLTVGVVPTSDDNLLLPIVESSYQHGQASEMVCPANITEIVSENIQACANYIVQKNQLTEIFYLDFIITDTDTLLLRNIRQGAVKEYAFTAKSWQHSIYELIARQALDQYISVAALKPSMAKSYSTFLKKEELSKVASMLPYFPEFNLDYRSEKKEALFSISEPNLIEALQKFYRIIK